MGGAPTAARRARESARRAVGAGAPHVGRVVRARYTVAVAAVAAFLLRLPAATRPLRSDESGFLLVARSWSPEPGSVYGPLFVDRSPVLIGLVRLTDAVAGPYALRVLGAICCALAVLLAAALARLVADDLTARWTALAVAALCASPLIDVVAVKGELLALPLLMLGVYAALRAARGQALAWALLSGVCGGLAVGLKQNLWGSLVFAVVLLVATAVAGRRPGQLRRAAALVAAVAGAALVPALVMAAWAAATGVGLDALWYAVAGFRSDASVVLAASPSGAPVDRAVVLSVSALGVGLLPVVGGFLVHLPDEWRDDAPLAAAVLAMLAFDVAGLALGGSYWKDYLFPMIVPAALCATMLARRRSRRGLAMRAVVLGMVVSSVASLGWWAWENSRGLQEYDEAALGRAVAEVAEPGDTLTVFGGRADVQYSSGLDTGYQYVWSLPMRVLDPGYRELETLLRGGDGPEWFVQWVPFESWGKDEAGSRLRTAVRDAYVLHGRGCSGRPVYLRAGLDRGPITPDCTGR